MFLAEITEDDPEVKKNSKRCCKQQVKVKIGRSNLFARYSSLNKLQRAVAWILRFKTYLKMKSGNESEQVVKGPLRVCELDCALLSIYRSVLQQQQQQAFPKLFSVFPNHEDITGSRETVSEEDLKGCEDLRRLLALRPFVASGILRVGGRLHNAALPYEAKHPVLFSSFPSSGDSRGNSPSLS